MKRKSMAVIGMVVGCLMMVAGAAWAFGPLETGTVNPNGTITIGTLVWLKDPNKCTGNINWDAAMSRAKSLKSGECGLTDGSKAGQWRLPTPDELIFICENKGLFQNIGNGDYWSSVTSYGVNNDYAQLVRFGTVCFNSKQGEHKMINHYSWPVRSAP